MYAENTISQEYLYGDGRKENLMDGSHKSKSEHPNAHTPKEINRIKRLLKRNPHATVNKIWYKMKRKYLYKRSITSLHRIIKKLTKKRRSNEKGLVKENMTKNAFPLSK